MDVHLKFGPVLKGFKILMGINKLPEIRVRPSGTPDRITRDRFEEITCFLHFVNDLLPSRGEEGYSRLQTCHNRPTFRQLTILTVNKHR